MLLQASVSLSHKLWCAAPSVVEDSNEIINGCAGWANPGHYWLIGLTLGSLVLFLGLVYSYASTSPQRRQDYEEHHRLVYVTLLATVVSVLLWYVALFITPVLLMGCFGIWIGKRISEGRVKRELRREAQEKAIREQQATLAPIIKQLEQELGR